MADEPLQIAMVLFPNLTLLDLVGPYEALNTPRAKISLLWHRIEPVAAKGGAQLLPNATFSDYGRADIVFVPGGPGQLAAMDDELLIAFIRDRARDAKYVTSVCTGSLVLAAAGLLKGRRATCHWASHDQLALMGAIPVQERVVVDGNIITGAGVTSGIDFGLVLAAKLWGEATAKVLQLGMEYDPAPPFSAGSTETASSETIETLRGGMAPLTERRLAAARRIAKERLGL